MPKDPKRNIQSYQIQGGHLNEFEFQQRQGEIAEAAELPLTLDAERPNLTQADRIAALTAEAHRKVEKRKKLGISKPASQGNVATRKPSSKKVARKSTKGATSTKKRATGTKTKKRSQGIAGGPKSAKTAVTSSKKTTKRVTARKVSKVKSRPR